MEYFGNQSRGTGLQDAEQSLDCERSKSHKRYDGREEHSRAHSGSRLTAQREEEGTEAAPATCTIIIVITLEVPTDQ